jgi:hypothetical protein
MMKPYRRAHDIENPELRDFYEDGRDAHRRAPLRLIALVIVMVMLFALCRLFAQDHGANAQQRSACLQLTTRVQNIAPEECSSEYLSDLPSLGTSWSRHGR